MFLKAKKSLGQNFLTDENTIEKIINLIEITNRNILEVGPGRGSLTKKIIAKNPSNLILVEKDKELYENLRIYQSENIEVKNEDILKFNLEKKYKEKFIVFGNLPYNISTEIICNWIINLGIKTWFSDLILMFQKEVADRIIAKQNEKNYGRLSIISQWRLDIEKKFDVSPNCFSPKPKVMSSILHFKNKTNYLQIQNPKSLEVVTRVFFNQRRKMIKNPIKQLFPNFEQIKDKLNLDLNLRPQNLSIETFLYLTKEYEKLRN